MTARTHDLGAFTGLTWILATQQIPSMSVATAFVGLGAVLLGATAPDLDEPTAGFWYRLPAGSIIGRIVHPFLGGHRMISHSLIGLALIGIGMRYLLQAINPILLVDMGVVWNAFMIGYISHLFMDMFTKEGVPLLFPLPLHVGIPPFRFLRIPTGGMAEKSIIFPGLLVLNGYIIWTNYETFFRFAAALGK